VCWNGTDKGRILGGGGVFLGPQVIDGVSLGGIDPHGFKVEADIVGFIATVQQRDNHLATHGMNQGTSPDFQVAVVKKAPGLVYIGALIDGDQVFVGDDFQGLLRELSEVVAQQEWGAHETPTSPEIPSGTR